MDGQGTSSEAGEVSAELRRRLAAGPSGRLADAVGQIFDHAFQVLACLRRPKNWTPSCSF
jgi:hydroxyquinol 1,2-dioxygenase